MVDSLATLEATHSISKQAFKSVQRAMLERIAGLSELIYEQKRAAIIVFEGWDAAGKGHDDSRFTERLDARVQGTGDAGRARTRREALAVALLDEHPPLWTDRYLRPELVRACWSSVRGADADARVDCGVRGDQPV